MLVSIQEAVDPTEATNRLYEMYTRPVECRAVQKEDSDSAEVPSGIGCIDVLECVRDQRMKHDPEMKSPFPYGWDLFALREDRHVTVSGREMCAQQIEQPVGKCPL
jgi:hypothetical protein